MGNFIKNTVMVAIPVVLALFGYWQYLRKREHELVIKRYLENGLDILAANIEHALSVYRYNFSTGLRILKLFKETQTCRIPMSSSEFPEKVKRFSLESFYTTPYYKLIGLVGEEGKIFWDAAQELFAYLDKTSNFYEDDLLKGIKKYLEGAEINVTLEDFYEEYLKKITELNKESRKFYSILGEIQNIIGFLETQHITFKRLKHFKDKPEVRECINRVNKKFNYLKINIESDVK